jgi:hypothetical protein
MPRSSRYGLRANELPRTLQHSSPEAQALFLQAHQEAVLLHGETDEASRAAYDALKQEFEKLGDRWVAKPTSQPG